MVELFDFGIRLVLAFFLAVAATGKMFDRPGTRNSMAAFGISGRFTNGFAVTLPVVEFVIAAILMVPASADAGAIGAFLLFAFFTAAMALAVVRGREGRCHCFGSIVPTKFGWHAVVRNAALTILAGACIVMGASITRSWSRGPSTTYEWIIRTQLFPRPFTCRDNVRPVTLASSRTARNLRGCWSSSNNQREIHHGNRRSPKYSNNRGIIASCWWIIITPYLCHRWWCRCSISRGCEIHRGPGRDTVR